MIDSPAKRTIEITGQDEVFVEMCQWVMSLLNCSRHET